MRFMSNYLTEKQEKQLMRDCMAFQPPFERGRFVFFDVLDIACKYCKPATGSLSDPTGVREPAASALKKLKAKYYFLPWKLNGKTALTKSLREDFDRYITGHTQIVAKRRGEPDSTRETILFVRLMRACRDYMATGMSLDGEARLFERLEPIRRAMLI